MAASKPIPPPPKSKPAPSWSASAPAENGGVTLEEPLEILGGTTGGPERVLLYAGGGMGKSTLASLMPGRTLFFDVERSTARLDVERVANITSYAHLCSLLTSSAIDPFDNVVIDSVTGVEPMAVRHTLEHVKTEKGATVTSVAAYPWGTGPSYVLDTFELFMQRLDGLVVRGKNIVLIAHACVAKTPNPNGEDFIRYEPRLQNPASGKGSIQARVFEWATQSWFIDLDVYAAEGKGVGSGTRTIYTSARPSWMAKHRGFDADAIPFTSKTDATIWSYVFPPKQDAIEEEASAA